MNRTRCPTCGKVMSERRRKPNAVAHWIYTARKEKKLSQLALGTLCGHPNPTWICDIERGKKELPASMLVTIAQHLEKDLNYFFQSYEQ